MAGTIAGTVVDIRTMQPMWNGANIAVQPGGHATKVGDDGSYSLSLDPGTYEMTVTANGYDPWSAEDIYVLDGVTTEIRIALWPSMG